MTGAPRGVYGTPVFLTAIGCATSAYFDVDLCRQLAHDEQQFCPENGVTQEGRYDQVCAWVTGVRRPFLHVELISSISPRNSRVVFIDAELAQILFIIVRFTGSRTHIRSQNPDKSFGGSMGNDHGRVV